MRTAIVFLITLFFSFTLTSCVTTVRATPNNIIVVKRLPRIHKVVYIKGHRYYKWNGVYHRKTTRGYVVVRV
ncbi:MAG: DUF6515 family protein [Lutibacter sp.]|jgi:hypothetical protein|uniref:DUF6515 family protein n=1 Tax=Lutibacter sp. TaxID=1925666 RepID=UPI00299EB20F|nr:DUF6515 family protein [Lutibacter sp.]MDX1829660.1 DUF6515 family protein [Lutibacter sp.]